MIHPYKQETTGLILAGGQGRRCGFRDKGLLQWQGKSLAAHVVARLKPQSAQLIISCNRNQTYYQSLAEKTVQDSYRDSRGPLAGIEAAGQYVNTPYLIISPCDTPLIPINLAELLITKMLSDSSELCYAATPEREHYLCLVARREILGSVRPCIESGLGAVRHWIARHKHSKLLLEDEPAFRNINRID